MSILSPSEEVRVDSVASTTATSVKAKESHLSLNAVDRVFKRIVLARLANLSGDGLRVHEQAFDSSERQDDDASLLVHSANFYRRAITGGSIGAAEAYIRGEWNSPDLLATMRVLARNLPTTHSFEYATWILRPLRKLTHWLKRNTLQGSRRNIAAHYDLSNDFFQLMLDPTMTYSSGIFATDQSTLEDASIEKYDRICRRLNLKPTDHLLEIGCGWGGFATYAASQYGCRVTATTISDQQYQYAESRIRQEGLGNQVSLLKSDYRSLTGQYDKLVSIEMIEAVGEAYLPHYFRQCSELLKKDGAAMIQAITIPDHRYDRYRRTVDFIQQYIFPGGFLPSVSAMGESIRRKTDFRVNELKDFGIHYARTLAAWRERFESKLNAVRDLGFDERFIRTWRYYLCYCEAAFREHQTGVCQLMLTKPEWRSE